MIRKEFDVADVAVYVLVAVVMKAFNVPVPPIDRVVRGRTVTTSDTQEERS